MIGEGARGAVFSAKSRIHSSEEVAIKVIPIREDAGIGDGIWEFVLQGWVRHPHIMPIRGFGAAGGCFYVVSDMARGGSVWDVIESHRNELLSPQSAFTIVHQAAEALDALHRSGIVHGDITPSNLLLENRLGDAPVNVQVVDFGFATLMDNTPSDVIDSGNLFLLNDLKQHFPEGPWRELPPACLKERMIRHIKEWFGQRTDCHDYRQIGLHGNLVDKEDPHWLKACLFYRAPEALRYDRDGRADQYALGAVAHELLTGRHPVDGIEGGVSGGIHKCWMVQQRDLSDGVYTVLKRSMAHGANGRFDTILEFSAALGNALGVEPLGTHRQRPPSTVGAVSFADLPHRFDNEGHLYR